MKNKPLSPHLDIYSFPLLSLLSIFHRVSGSFLVIIAVLIAPLVIYISNHYDPFSFNTLPLVYKIGIAGSIYALCYHIFSGIRHLVMDMGYGFSLTIAYFMAYTTLVAALLSGSIINIFLFFR